MQGVSENTGSPPKICLINNIAKKCDVYNVFVFTVCGLYCVLTCVLCGGKCGWFCWKFKTFQSGVDFKKQSRLHTVAAMSLWFVFLGAWCM